MKRPAIQSGRSSAAYALVAIITCSAVIKPYGVVNRNVPLIFLKLITGLLAKTLPPFLTAELSKQQAYFRGFKPQPMGIVNAPLNLASPIDAARFCCETALNAIIFFDLSAAAIEAVAV